MKLNKNIDQLSEQFVDNILETNRSFDVYVDWRNATRDNFKEYDIELNALNTLIRNASKDKFYELVKKLPTVVCTFPLLIAVAKADRNKIVKGKKELVIVDTKDIDKDFLRYDLSKAHTKSLTNEDYDLYYEFFRQSGLQNLFQNMLDKNVIDYVTGVLVGLDSNGRKNRSGRAFEVTCEPLIREIAHKFEIDVITQKKFKEIKKLGFQVTRDISDRKADFILVKGNKALNIEVDFFDAAGSKPEEIIDSYINRQNDLAKISCGLILITDGNCWNNKEKNQLQKGFRNLDYLMNYNLAKKGLLEESIKDFFDIK